MKFSIITIVYNNREHINNCINSVLSQKGVDIEYIVIDGGSTDGTQAEIEPFCDRIFHYVSEQDHGLYNALNKGISLATGDVVGILHSDDLFWSDRTLQVIATAFQSHSIDLVYAKGVFVDRDNTEKIRRVYSSRPFKPIYLFFGWIPLHTTIFVKREIFDRYGLYDEGYAIASDYEISLRWFKNSHIKKYFINEYVVKMRLGGKSTNIKLQKLKSREDYEIIVNMKLLGVFTLLFKILRKIPQFFCRRI